MNCERARDLIWSRSSAGEDLAGLEAHLATDSDLAGLEAHLADCSECRSVARSVADIARALDAERRLVPSAELRAGIMAVPDRDRRRRRLVPLALPLAALLCVLSSVVLWGIYPREQRSSMGEPPGASAVPVAAEADEGALERTPAPGTEGTSGAVTGRGDESTRIAPIAVETDDLHGTPARARTTRLAFARTATLPAGGAISGPGAPGTDPGGSGSDPAPGATRGATTGTAPVEDIGVPGGPTATATPPSGGGDRGWPPTATVAAPGGSPPQPSATGPTFDEPTATRPPESGPITVTAEPGAGTPTAAATIPDQPPEPATLTPEPTLSREPGRPISPTPPSRRTAPAPTSAPTSAPTLPPEPIPGTTTPAPPPDPGSPTSSPAPGAGPPTNTPLPSVTPTLTITPTLTVTPTPGLLAPGSRSDGSASGRSRSARVSGADHAWGALRWMAAFRIQLAEPVGDRASPGRRRVAQSLPSA